MNKEMLYGKTIKKIDDNSVNQVVFFFTDNTVAVYDTENNGYGYGPELIAFGTKEQVEKDIGYSLE